MARIQLTDDDLSGGELVEPSWFACECTKYEEKPATTDRSTNYIMYWKVIGEKHKGARTRVLLNEKAMGFGKNLFLALGAKIVRDSVTGKQSMTPIELNAETTVGKKIDIYLARGTSNKGNDFNDAKDYAPLGSQSGFKG
jgi:hypothetical protein